MQQTARNEGFRLNQGKSRVDLVPPDATKAVADLMTVMLEKYPERNWEKGLSWGGTLASLERHLLAAKAGQDVDPSDNQLQAAKLAWNSMVYLAMQLRGIGTDDRVRLELPEIRPVMSEAQATTAIEDNDDRP